MISDNDNDKDACMFDVVRAAREASRGAPPRSRATGRRAVAGRSPDGRRAVAGRSRDRRTGG